MIAAINGAGRPAIVRILWNEPGLVGQVLDAGAVAIIAPMINSKAQAEALVRAAKYPPLGARSWGGYTALQASGLTPAEYLAQANRLTQVFAMIETEEALARVEEIAAVKGLDGLFVGPSDLSITLSKGAGIDKTGQATLTAMKKIAEAARRNNLVAGAFGGNAEVVRAYLELGYRFIAAGVDADILQAGAAALVKAIKGV
jgi:4-hydroxy-2-oxoheptanedioate aldolase